MRRRRGVRSSLVSIVVVLAVAGSCARERAARSPEDLASERGAFDASLETQAASDVGRMFARVKRELDDHLAGRAPSPPTIDVLVVSGGGDWGAFGAGVLRGWARVEDPALRRPEFDIVTGVSTGALIGPFAFLGDDESIERIATLYRNPEPDWAVQRSFLNIFVERESLADTPGLERDMKAIVDRDLIGRIAGAGRDGRLLYVSATNVDWGVVRPFELGAEADRAIESGDLDRFHRVLLASAAIPGVFPPREIDDGLYVDGAVTGNILYGARLRGERSFHSRWTSAYPGVPMPKMRYWVIFNNQLRFPPDLTQPVLGEIVARSLSISTQQATVSAIRHLFAQAAADRLEHGTEVEVRLLAIEDGWRPKTPGAFLHETMNALADMGERFGADPASWRTESP